jgi:hypothetical protein
VREVALAQERRAAVLYIYRGTSLTRKRHPVYGRAKCLPMLGSLKTSRT